MPQTFFEAEAVLEIADRLIGTYHPDLATARIKYLFQEKAGKKNGKVVLGVAKKVSGILEHFADCDFLLVVGQDAWNELDGQKKTALVDHLLERCTGIEDPEDPGAEMKWTTREPDVHEFSTILSRYGAWSEDLAGFIAIAQSLGSEIEESAVDRVITRRSQSEDIQPNA